MFFKTKYHMAMSKMSQSCQMSDVRCQNINKSNTLLAKHCIETTFYKWCIYERDCTAYFRDLVPGPANFEEGEFWVPLVDMFVKEGKSDLAIVKLAYPVIFLMHYFFLYLLSHPTYSGATAP